MTIRTHVFDKKEKATNPLHGKPATSHGPPGARTLDTLIKSQVLYQLS